MREVVEVNPRNGIIAQIFRQRHFAKIVHRIVFLAEFQRYERTKTACFVLQFAKAREMVDALGVIFLMTVKHCCIGAYAEFVSRAVDFEPDGRFGLFGTNLGAEFLVKNLLPTAGYALQTAVNQFFETVLNRKPRFINHIFDLNRRKSLDNDARNQFLDLLHQAAIIIDVAVGMHTANYVNLSGFAAFVNRHTVQNFVHRKFPRLRIVLRLFITAKLAIVDAYVGRLDVEITVIIYLIA